MGDRLFAFVTPTDLHLTLVVWGGPIRPEGKANSQILELRLHHADGSTSEPVFVDYDACLKSNDMFERYLKPALDDL